MEYIILLVALATVVLGADFLVDGTVAIARKLKISDFVIGAVIIGVGTSLPELIVSVIGAIEGNPDIAIGNVVGSNIFNVLGILGITAIIMPVSVPKSNLKFEIPFCIGISVLLMLLTYNFFNGSERVIGRIDGLILLALFAVFLYTSFVKDRQNGHIEAPSDQVETKTPLWLALIKTIGGLAMLAIGCHFFVDEAVVIAHNLGVNEAFISITLIACGTSLPELAASIAAALKKSTSMALGNIVGSNIFNISLILGLSAQITPLTPGGITGVDYVVMIIASLFPLVCGIKGKVTRLSGLVMFICFVIYNAYLIRMQIG